MAIMGIGVSQTPLNRYVLFSNKDLNENQATIAKCWHLFVVLLLEYLIKGLILNGVAVTINPFPGLLKTLWEKEKLLVTSNFSFSRSVFYSFGELSAIFKKI